MRSYNVVFLGWDDLQIYFFWSLDNVHQGDFRYVNYNMAWNPHDEPFSLPQPPSQGRFFHSNRQFQGWRWTQGEFTMQIKSRQFQGWRRIRGKFTMQIKSMFLKAFVLFSSIWDPKYCRDHNKRLPRFPFLGFWSAIFKFQSRFSWWKKVNRP